MGAHTPLAILRPPCVLVNLLHLAGTHGLGLWPYMRPEERNQLRAALESVEDPCWCGSRRTGQSARREGTVEAGMKSPVKDTIPVVRVSFKCLQV